VLSATTLAHLRPHAVLVNVGRGDTIDAHALLAALDTQALAGAALDVMSLGPLHARHALFGQRDVLFTPRLTGRTVGVRGERVRGEPGAVQAGRGGAEPRRLYARVLSCVSVHAVL
jgi:phosphoglycerate dehydrogenase-like enzyme